MAIERSAGLAIGAGGLIAGAGYQGITANLDAVVAEAAEALTAAYGMDVTIRFNSDRASGGAWLRTHAVDCFGANAEAGIAASVVTARARHTWECWAADCPEEGWAQYLRDCPEGMITVYAHIAASSAGPVRLAELRELDGWNQGKHCYHHGAADSVDAALARCLRFVPPGTFAGRI